MATIVDLTNIGEFGFVLRGAGGDAAGTSVQSAGDVNGDGFDDVIVGSPKGAAAYDEPYSFRTNGSAYVIFGNGAEATASIKGAVANDAAGTSVSSAGDVNGDGFGDIIIGAPGADGGGAEAGSAYVIFGRAGGLGAIQLSALDPADGFAIQGDAAGDAAGRSVSSAGDVNGDGYDDLIVGAPGGDNGGTSAGEAYVVFGKASDFSTIDLTSLAPSDGFIIQSDNNFDQAGLSVASAGDLNADGYADINIGAPSDDDGGPSAGEAYVIFGRAEGFGTIDLTNLDPHDGFIIRGDEAGDQAGQRQPFRRLGQRPDFRG